MADWQNIVQRWAEQHRGQGHVLCLITCGNHFGGSPCAVRLALENYDVAEGFFEFSFRDGEVLTVMEPRGVGVEEGGVLVVESCEFMSLEWHVYGKPQTPETLCNISYINGGPGVLRQEIPPSVFEHEVGGVDVLVIAHVPD